MALPPRVSVQVEHNAAHETTRGEDSGRRDRRAHVDRRGRAPPARGPPRRRGARAPPPAGGGRPAPPRRGGPPPPGSPVAGGRRGWAGPTVARPPRLS